MTMHPGCIGCGAPTEGRGWKGPKRYCSRECYRLTDRAARPPEPDEARRSCRRCGHSFYSAQPHAAFCTRECYRLWHKCYGLGERVKRAAMKRLVKVRLAIFERDAWRCGICGLAINRALPVNHPLAVTLDHIMPTSAGGSDDPGNLQAAHRQCNVEKADDIGWRSWTQTGAAS